MFDGLSALNVCQIQTEVIKQQQPQTFPVKLNLSNYHELKINLISQLARTKRLKSEISHCLSLQLLSQL
jgi:hypothetical protein